MVWCLPIPHPHQPLPSRELANSRIVCRKSARLTLRARIPPMAGTWQLFHAPAPRGI
jgi:hypothetical protein